MFVADASTVLKWFLPGQETDDALRAYRRARRSPIVVPAIWQYEVENALLKLIRRRQLTIQRATDVRIELQLIAKRRDERLTDEIFEQTWIIAANHMITYYDASYVELALRLNLPLATGDQAEKNAAKALGIRLV